MRPQCVPCQFSRDTATFFENSFSERSILGSPEIFGEKNFFRHCDEFEDVFKSMEDFAVFPS